MGISPRRKKRKGGKGRQRGGAFEEKEKEGGRLRKT